MNTKLEALWIVGFVDGEGCFNFSVSCQESCFGGIQIQLEFTVVQHERDVQLLHSLKDYFKGGSVAINRQDETSTRYHYRAKSLANLAHIIEFFEKHPLKTKKNIEFQNFRTIYRLLKEGVHLKSKSDLLRVISRGAKLRYPAGSRIQKNSKVRQRIQALREEVLEEKRQQRALLHETMAKKQKKCPEN